MGSPLSNGTGRLGGLPTALGLLATANIGEESIAESWPVGKARFRPLFGRLGTSNSAQRANLPSPQDQVAPFPGRELEVRRSRNALPVRNQSGAGQHFPLPAALDPKACFHHTFGINQAVQPGKVRLIVAREVATGIPGYSGNLNCGSQV